MGMKTAILGCLSGIEYDHDKFSSFGFVKRVDLLMKKGHEFLVGDGTWGFDKDIQDYLKKSQYDSVSVFVSGSKRGRHYNAGKWKEIFFSVNGSSHLARKLERIFGIVEAADQGIVVWNGESNENWIAILYLIAMGKKCDFYLVKDERWVSVDSILDIQPYSGDALDPYSEVGGILYEIGFSEEMCEFLASPSRLSVWQLIDAIYLAPIPIWKKRKILSNILEYRNIKNELYEAIKEEMDEGCSFEKIKKRIRRIADYSEEESVWTYLMDTISEIVDAQKALTYHNAFGDIEAIFYLFDMWYDTDVFFEKKYDLGAFLSYSKVLEYVKNEEKEDGVDEESYYLTELWVYNVDSKSMEKQYEYYIYKDEICWFDKMESRIDSESGNTYYCKKKPFSRQNHMRDYNLDGVLTPYKTGDIVRIDCRPFAPPFNALVLEARDQYDSCFPNIVFKRPHTEEWVLEPLKSNRFCKDLEWTSYIPMLPSVYRVRTVTDDEVKEEDELMRLCDSLAGDVSKAARIWERWEETVYSFEQIMRIFDET